MGTRTELRTLTAPLLSEPSRGCPELTELVRQSGYHDGVPKRSTPFQAIVHYLRKQTAAPGVTVTESKELLDESLGIKREVDIVIEGSFDGEPVVTSIEVIEHSRRASITWVEQQIKKHRALPTNRLVLVSKSGFSKNALTAVTVEGGWVQAMTPKIVQEDGQDIVKSIFLDQIQLMPLHCRLTVPHPDEGVLTVLALADNVIFDVDGQPLGFAVELAREFLSNKGLVEALLKGTHEHPERANVKGFAVGTGIGDLDYHLRDDETGQLHLILAIEVMGKFEFKQSEMIFTAAELGDRRYGSGEGMILDQPGVWVATTNKDTGTTTISLSTKNSKPSIEPPLPPPPTRFAAISTLERRRTELEIVRDDGN